MTRILRKINSGEVMTFPAICVALCYFLITQKQPGTQPARERSDSPTRSQCRRP